MVYNTYNNTETQSSSIQKPKFNLFDFSTAKVSGSNTNGIAQNNTASAMSVKPQNNVYTPSSPASMGQKPLQTKQSNGGIFGIPTANASSDNSLFDIYMNDPNISKQGKFKMLTQLQNGEITEEDANEIISRIYGDNIPKQDNIQEKPKTGIFNTGIGLIPENVRFGHLDPAYTHEDIQNSGVVGANLKRVANFGIGAINFMGSLGNIVLHPADTLQSIVDVGAQGILKLANAVGLTNVGPEDTKAVDAVGEYLKRYKIWTPEGRREFQKQLDEDPFSIAGDIATVVSGGATRGAKLAKVGNMAKTADVLEKTANVANKINPYIQTPVIAGKTAIGTKNVLTKTAQNISNIIPDTQKIAQNISTKANRFTAGDERIFTQKIGETPGEFAVKRGMTEVGEKAVEQAIQNYIASYKEADKGLAQIKGNFTTKGTGDDIIGDAVQNLKEKVEAQPRNKDKTRILELYNKYNSDGYLTMSEINEVKRLLAKNNVYTWNEKRSDKAINATNLQDDLREWQFKKAEEMGFSNLREINKTTQGWKYYADFLSKKLLGSQANNMLSLSDLVALSGGNASNVALYLGKKIGGSDYIKSKIIKALGKQTKSAVITPDINKPEIKGLLDKGPVITPPPAYKSNIKVTPSTIQPNVRLALPKGAIITPQTQEAGIIQESKTPLKRTKFGTTKYPETKPLALPEGRKSAIITPQTKEAGIIQESKLPLKKTKYGTNTNISSDLNNNRLETKLKSKLKSKVNVPEEKAPILNPKEEKTTKKLLKKTNGKIVSDVKQTPKTSDDLYAVHGLTEENLKKVIELGGFPGPSIAVVKKEGLYNDYGDIQVIFNKSAIDPTKNKANKLYSADIYSPRVRVDKNGIELRVKSPKLTPEELKALKIFESEGGEKVKDFESKQEVIDNLTSSDKFYEYANKIGQDGYELANKIADKLFETKAPDLDTITKKMFEKGSVGQENFGMTLFKLKGMLAKQYKTFGEIDRFKIIPKEEERVLYDKAYQIYSKFGEKFGIRSFDYFLEDIARKSHSDANIMKYAKNNMIKLDKQDVKDIKDFLEYVKELPVSYLEAKPERGIRFDEVEKIFVPKDRFNIIQDYFKKANIDVEGKLEPYSDVIERQLKIKGLDKKYGNIFFSIGGVVVPAVYLYQMLGQKTNQKL